MTVKQGSLIEVKRDENVEHNNRREEVECRQKRVANQAHYSSSDRSISFTILQMNDSDTVTSRTATDRWDETKFNKAKLDKVYINAAISPLYKLFLTSLCIIMLLTYMPLHSAQAASSNSVISNVDTLYDSITALERVLELQNVQIRALREQNNTALKAVQERIRKLDTARLATMKATLKQLENQHAPLLQHYTDLGKQIANARKKKNDRLVQSLLLEHHRIQAQVIATRTELQNKRTELAAARQASTVRKQQLRSLLQPVQTLKKQITSENKAITSAWKVRTAARKSYHAAVRQDNAVTALVHLTVVYKQLGQIQTSRQKILQWEQQITRTIETVASRSELMTAQS